MSADGPPTTPIMLMSQPPPPLPRQVVGPDEIVIPIGVVIGVLKLLFVLHRIWVLVRTEWTKCKQQHNAALRRAFTMGDNLASPVDDDHYMTHDGMTELNTMPEAIRVPQLSGSPRHSASMQPPTFHSSSAVDTSSYFQLLGQQYEMHNLKPFRIDDRELVVEAQIGKGSYGDVWRGVYRHRVVAIKTLVATQTHNTDDVSVFVNEIKIMVELRHPCVCAVLGAVWMASGDIKMVLEYMPRGDLKQYLATSNPSVCGWDDKYFFALDIADGLVYIHSRHIIHRDLKSRNILLADVDNASVPPRVGAKVTDFGLSRYFGGASQASFSCGVGTYRWMAPEMIIGTRYTNAVDIYAFGMILSEMDSHQVPFWDERTPDGQLITDMGIQDKVRRGDLRPKFTSACPGWIEALATRCTAFTPRERPTADDVRTIIQQHIESSLVC
ncbi:Aste57867_17446 [Aphanomyces stellatus]|uniref:Aste57867_17446 protein n=1 Tax=Aphanomyces stellatus TaxID=120398 RepID=A0A485L924_9STRA|nr:hypothetical protein As57867_017386 [Aphanomyces stellatus]VFT94200.1 Aste57867_17446 [Aphanomyces stellatus]